MLTKQQVHILGIFNADIFARLTFKQIKERSRQKSNNIVQIALKEFKKQNILEVQRVGDISTYSLKNNNLTKSYLNLINELEVQNNKKLPKKILSDIQNRIFRNTEFFILLVFGGYAKNKATEKSDLDVAIIVESEQSKKEVTPFLETIKRREVINLDYHVFTRSEFLEMLESPEENLGKEIYRKNIIYYGAIQYYNLIAKEHGPIS